MSRSLSTPALLVRHARSNVGASVLVAILVLVVTLVVAIAPRALTQLSTAELHHGLASVAVPLRDVSNEAHLAYTSGDGETELPSNLAGTYGLMDQSLRRVLTDVPQPLHSALGQPDYFGRTDVALPAPSTDTTKNGVGHLVRFAADARIESRVTMTVGTFPAAQVANDVMQVTMSTDSAKEMAWDVGEVREVTGSPAIELSGTFDPKDPGARYWQHATSVVVPQIADDGNTRKVTATVYINPATAVTGDIALDFLSLTVWYPLDSSTIDVGNATTVQAQLRKLLGTVHSLPGGNIDQPFDLQSSALDAIDTSLARTAVTSAVLSMTASGPLGVVLAVFALGARSVVERRRPALALASARGGSGWQVRGAMALEGLVLGVVPGAIAIVLAGILLPVPVGPSASLPAALLALAPAVLFALAGSPSGLRTTRADLNPRARGRARWITELLVVLLAAVALFLLLRRGLVSSGTFDPLLAATPLLLSLAACVVVLRVYPFPLYALERRLRRGRGLVGFVGASRAVRDPAVGVAGALAIVVAVSVAVFSTTLLTTIDHYVQQSARTAVAGGDVVAQSAFFSDAQRTAIESAKGVGLSASIDDQGQVALVQGTTTVSLDLLEADATRLAQIRGDLPAHLDRTVAGRVPVVLSSYLVSQLGSTKNLTLQGTPVTVVGVLPADSGIAPTARWVLVDTSFARSMVDLAFAPQLIVMTTDADPATVADAVVATAPQATVTTYQQALASTQDSPTVGGLTAALYAAILAVSLLAAIAVILTSVINAPSRDRAIGSLRTLGLSSRQTAGLVLWELAPVVITALLVGTLLGLVLPRAVTSTVDLSAFTGGTPVAGPYVDAARVLIVLGIVALATVISAVVAVFLSLRSTPASTVKIGAD